MEHRDNLTITSGDNVLVIDNGCDQSTINIKSCLIGTFDGIHFSVNGLLNKIGSTTLERVSDAYTLVSLDNNKKVVFKINQCVFDRDPNQTEALL